MKIFFVYFTLYFGFTQNFIYDRRKNYIYFNVFLRLFLFLFLWWDVDADMIDILECNFISILFWWDKAQIYAALREGIPYHFFCFYRTQVSLGSDLWVRFSLTKEPFCRLNLSDEDTNSILTDNANRAIQGYLAMQVGHQMAPLALVPNLAIRWHHLYNLYNLYNLHCQIALDCPIGIIS